ncbi:MAG: alpha/beta hydrolase-fold protein [Verrucomicrobiota bacterium]
MLALHGNLGSVADWKAFPEVVPLDLWQWSHLSMDAVADRLREQGDRELMGYSMGGRLAIHALARHPDYWEKVVILSAHPGLASAEERQARRDHDDGWAKKARNLPWVDFLQEWNAQPVFAGDAISAEQQRLEDRRDEISCAFENWSLGQQPCHREAIRNFCGDLRWLVGGEDRKFLQLAAEMSINYQIVKNAGHRLLGKDNVESVRALIFA